MHKKLILSIFIITILIGSAWLFYNQLPEFSELKPETKLTKKLHCVCTTGMIGDLVHTIGGNNIQLNTLMGPGVDPHLYRAKESDMYLLAKSDIIFYNGLHLEGKIGEVLEHMGKKTVALGNKLPKEELRESSFKNVYDPHIWHDVILWQLITKEVANSLALLDSANAQTYQENADKYVKKLEYLHNYIIKCVNSIPLKQRILVTAHDAFAYFGKRYGLEVIGLQGMSTDSDISTRDIQKLADFIVSHKIRAIFVESSIPHRNIEAVVRAIQARNWNVKIGNELYSDALGDKESGADTYIDMIKHNIDTITLELAS